MKKTWHIGERCRFGTFKILNTTENSVSVGLSYYKQKKVEVEETFNVKFDLIMWLEDQMDSYHASLIVEEIEKNGIMLKQNSMW